MSHRSYVLQADPTLIRRRPLPQTPREISSYSDLQVPPLEEGGTGASLSTPPRHSNNNGDKAFAADQFLNSPHTPSVVVKKHRPSPSRPPHQISPLPPPAVSQSPAPMQSSFTSLTSFGQLTSSGEPFEQSLTQDLGSFASPFPTSVIEDSLMLSEPRQREGEEKPTELKDASLLLEGMECRKEPTVVVVQQPVALQLQGSDKFTAHPPPANPPYTAPHARHPHYLPSVEPPLLLEDYFESSLPLISPRSYTRPPSAATVQQPPLQHLSPTTSSPMKAPPPLLPSPSSAGPSPLPLVRKQPPPLFISPIYSDIQPLPSSDGLSSVEAGYTSSSSSSCSTSMGSKYFPCSARGGGQLSNSMRANRARRRVGRSGSWLSVCGKREEESYVEYLMDVRPEHSKSGRGASVVFSSSFPVVHQEAPGGEAYSLLTPRINGF